MVTHVRFFVALAFFGTFALVAAVVEESLGYALIASIVWASAALRLCAFMSAQTDRIIDALRDQNQEQEDEPV